MRNVVRISLIFAFSTAVMGAAWGAGYVTAGRLSDRGFLDAGPLRTVTDRFRAPKAAAPAADDAEDADEPLAASDPDSAGRPSAGSAPEEGGETGDHFDVFWEAWQAIEDDFHAELPPEKDLTYGAIRGSLRALEDPYTLFTDPVNTEVQRPDLEGEFEGIGAFVTQNEEGLLVIQTPMRGQPAEKAGVEAGDIVVEVDGTDITEMDINEAVLLIRGPKGTVVELLIVREGVDEPLLIPVERDRIEVPSVAEVRLLEEEGAPEIGYMQLTVFAQETRQELIDAIEELRDQGAVALILDLRNNPGGFLSAAVGVTSEFVDDGVVTVREDNEGRQREERVVGGGNALDIPLVVLVNQGSASASEIVAGAIRDYDRGVLVGERTFGKGSVQNVHELRDGSQLRVTVEIWRTPNGSLIHKQGIQPDIIVTPEPSEEESEVAAAEDQPEGVDGAEEDAEDGSDASSQDEGGTEDESSEDGSPAADVDAEREPDVQLERAIDEARKLIGGGA